jgi:hypothetical protein
MLTSGPGVRSFPPLRGRTPSDLVEGTTSMLRPAMENHKQHRRKQHAEEDQIHAHEGPQKLPQVLKCGPKRSQNWCGPTLRRRRSPPNSSVRVSAGRRRRF